MRKLKQGDEVIVTGYCDHLRELAAKDRERLDGMIPEVPF